MHAAFDVAARLHGIERGAGRQLLREGGSRGKNGQGGKACDLHINVPSTLSGRYRTSLDMTSKFHLEKALTPDGWQDDVVVEVEHGTITAVTTLADAPDGTPGERVSGTAVPGLPNLHSHAFQRAMAGLAEKRGSEADSFWTWP